MLLAICFVRTPGLKIDAEVLASTLSKFYSQGRHRIVLVEVPKHALQFSSHQLSDYIAIGERIDISIFLEQVINHPRLMEAPFKIIIPNPEWFYGQSAQLARHFTDFWHKSRFSYDQISPFYQNSKHTYLGFTSSDPGVRVDSHLTFLHARGNFRTQRNTQSVIDCWIANPDFPELFVHLYGEDLGLDIPCWLTNANYHLRFGWLEREAHLSTAKENGIHICTSEAEGFGHYINEARAMGALIITTDAPPMNELIDKNCGILVPPSQTYQRGPSKGFKVSQPSLSEAIKRVISLSPESRMLLGTAARARFESDRAAFEYRLKLAVQSYLDL